MPSSIELPYDHPVIKYLGSKRTLVARIAEIADRLPGVETACDIFTGTTRVAQGLKRKGLRVTANDLATYSEVLALCYVEADRSALDLGAIERKLRYLESLPGVDGYFTETFCLQARYFQPHNGRRIDAMRRAIDEIAEDRIERGILLTSLMEAADRVDSTTGLQMAYLKEWAPRSYKDIKLRLPRLTDGGGSRAMRRDANELAKDRSIGFDLVYIDPPYNQHSYFSNYHIWETLVRNDEPDTYGIARKRLDCKTNKSAYNSKRLAWQTFSDLIESLQAPYLLVSFSNEGYFTQTEIADLLTTKGETAVLPIEFKRYVGAQIGIHNLRGEKVGKVSHLRNKEFLFLVGDGATEIIGETAKASAA
jgi:adenine-specific DNA-methyltransferase